MSAKPAYQARSKATRDKLIAALDRLLSERRFEEIGVADIAKEAGVSVGALYRRFEGKDAFIPVLFDLYRTRLDGYERTQREAASLRTSKGLRGALRQTLATAREVIERDGHLFRAVHLYARIRPELVGEEWAPLIEASRHSVRVLIRAHADEITAPDEDVAVEAVTYFLNTILIEEGVYGDVGPPLAAGLNGRALAEEMADFAYGYLVLPR